MKIADIHTHTALCKHAEGEPEEYLAAALALGESYYGVADHCPFPAGFEPEWRMDESEFPQYRRIIRDLRAKAAGTGLTVLYGMEMDWAPGRRAEVEAKLAADRFHARYRAVGKLYTYTCYVGDTKPVFNRKYVTVLDYQPDLAAMQRAAEYLTGEHDYKSFCSNPQMKKSTVRIVDSIEIVRRKDYIYFNYHGTGFLQNMVRILTGTLLEVGQGKRTPESVRQTLEAKDRTQAGYTAPPQGLCLMRVDY